MVFQHIMQLLLRTTLSDANFVLTDRRFKVCSPGPFTSSPGEDDCDYTSPVSKDNKVTLKKDCPLIECPPEKVKDSQTLHREQAPTVSQYATFQQQLDYDELSEAQAITDAALEDQEIDAVDNQDTQLASKINHVQFNRLTLADLDLLIESRLPPYTGDQQDQDPRNLTYFSSLNICSRRCIQMRILIDVPHYINTRNEWVPRVHRGNQCSHCIECCKGDYSVLYRLGSYYSCHSFEH